MNREDARLSEINQTQKSIPGGRKQAGVGARGWEEGGKGRNCLMNVVSLWGDENILRLNRGGGCST